MRGLKRIRQVFWYLWPSASELPAEWAGKGLTPAQRRLFEGMSRPDRAHAIRVATRLAGRQAPAWVLEAALLHDCGKPAWYGLFWRCAGVVLDRWLPDEAESAGEPDPHAPWAGLHIYRWHDALGFAAAEQAGTSPRALELLKHYAQVATPEAPDPELSHWLTHLSASDDEG
ncbi:MAG: hypothetical protein VKP62_01095 [Candidatus Sericytochromatia bacterium]|nr:hypothetical protein [Candidatus Sericytochromatia bacterium]